ncbi:sec1-like protein [Artemisia annua]|uniref:Sec1-like protein n=1 Tax=Artemisia annua TaxID=35608 RepID=A0A2U1MJ30_ARTAN|nr:sec1-like protein [Artemisia annua]
MTGLNIDVDRILEIACIITDGKLTKSVDVSISIPLPLLYQLSRFYPIIEELIEKLSKNELPVNEYPCMNDPSPTFHGVSHAVSARVLDTPSAHSMRSRRSTWARPRNSEDWYSSDSVLRRTTSEFRKMGKRIFIFIVGGATRSELRVSHKLTTKLRREIILGSSSLVDPAQFVENGDNPSPM